MARILCISSYVARGHIGLGAAVPALHALGHEVVALPTVVLSNHPGHPAFIKQDIEPEFLTKSVDTYGKSGWLTGIDAVLSGYLPSADHVAAVAQIVSLVRRANSKSIYVCDPVLGDDPGGLYIPEPAAAAIRSVLVDLANVLTPNRYELEWLTGHKVRSIKEAAVAAHSMACPMTVVTSVPTGQADSVANVLAGPSSGPHVVTARTLAQVPHGTGDLLAGLFVGHMLNGHTPAGALDHSTAGVAATVAVSDGCDELDLTNSRAQWVDTNAT